MFDFASCTTVYSSKYESRHGEIPDSTVPSTGLTVWSRTRQKTGVSILACDEEGWVILGGLERWRPLLSLKSWMVSHDWWPLIWSESDKLWAIIPAIPRNNNPDYTRACPSLVTPLSNPHSTSLTGALPVWNIWKSDVWNEHCIHQENFPLYSLVLSHVRLSLIPGLPYEACTGWHKA